MKIFNFTFENKKNKIINVDNNLIFDQFYEIGQLIKEARIQKNLSIEELSKISKIPESTINAIENNIKEYRPKYPFIRSILLKLEKCLSLKINTLAGLALNKREISTKGKKNYIVRKFDFINSWQGSIVYFLFLIFTLFIINRYFSSNINLIEIQIIENKTNEI